MKLQFKNQAFQEAATAAVCDVFNGQPFHDPNKYTVDPGRDETQGGFRQDLHDLQDYGAAGTGNPVNPVNPVKKALCASAALRETLIGAPLVACLDAKAKMTTEFFLEIAKLKPGLAFFRDDAFADDSARTNLQQAFDQFSPTTSIKVI